jgi:AcrR family transcriptional regulator
VRRTAERAAAPTLAERKRQMVRDELGTAALRLLARQGFDETTVDQIVAAAGVSRRTFFRYFESKEDVIIQFVGDAGALILAEVAERPAEETPAQAVREAVKVVIVGKFAEFPEKSLALIRFTLGIPALRARYVSGQDVLRGELARVLARRLPEGESASGVDLTAGIALLAFTEALTRWSASGGERDFAEVIDEVFAEAATAFGS